MPFDSRDRSRSRSERNVQKSKELPPDEYGANWSKLLDGQPRVESPITCLPCGNDVEPYLERLNDDGCVIIRNAVPLDTVHAFKQEHDRVLEIVGPTLTRLQQDQQVDGMFYKGEEYVQGLRVRKNAHGRFEFSSIDHRDGGQLVKETTRLADLADPLVLPTVVRMILEHAMVMPWRMVSCGTLPTFPGAKAGSWHRDTNQMFGDEALDLSLPDFYFNMLLPLDEITAANGTEILLGSHKVVQEKTPSCRSGVMEASPGDVIIFNGKSVHRGRPNTGINAKQRLLLYVVFAPRWLEPGRKQLSHDWLSSKPYDD